MSVYDDATVMRLRDRDGLDTLEREWSPADQGTKVRLLKTTHIATYPTVAGVAYAVKDVLISGTEAEGVSATYTPQGSPFLAVNVGSGIPPEGTLLLGTQIDGFWVFLYD